MQKIKSEKIEPFSKKEEHNKRNDKNGQKICMIYIYIQCKINSFTVTHKVTFARTLLNGDKCNDFPSFWLNID